MAAVPEESREFRGLRLQRWGEDEWLAREEAWSGLLRDTCADQLFMSWDWLTAWWRQFGGQLRATADIHAYFEGDRLVGLVPVYRRRLLRSGVLPAESVQMMGLAWRDSEPLISEYLDVIARPEHVEGVRRTFVSDLLLQDSWTEFVVGFTPHASAWIREYMGSGGVSRHYARQLDQSVSYQADLSAGFQAYLGALHQSTRRSLWSLRSRLSAAGKVVVRSAPAQEVEAGFAELNRLHEMRWGRPAFIGQRLDFHLRFARSLARQGELRLSRMSVDGRVVSVLYDVLRNGRQYNIKMAFDPTFSRKLSIGLIHLGYAMEAAAADRATLYDFLAGPGKTTDFKRLLSQKQCPLSSVQMVRGALLPGLYRWRDRFRT
ncbi:MAG: GNAT family N-acetyltransferase [Proteobacteria bacterium]|nr:GNAT family N-acetyltransferase [Pseudomonadota bacterium]